MIKQQKLLKNLLLLFCFGVIILSCSLEDEVIQEHNHANNVKVEKVNYNELFKQKLFSNTMKRIPKKKIAVTNEFGKSVMEEQYGFTIIDTPVKVVEIDGKISYTIQIVTDNNLDGKLENLILYPDADIDKMGYIIKYNTLKNNQLSEQQVIDGGANEIKPLISSNSDENAKFTMITILTYFCTAAGTPEDCGGFDGGPCYVINNTFSGVFSPSGSSYSYNSSNSYANYVNSSNSNFGGANNSNNENSNNQLVITPINCHICPNLDIEEEIVETPCDELNKLTENPSYPTNPNMDNQDKRIRTAIINMGDEINPNGENGYAFYNQGNYPQYGPFANYTPASNTNHVNFTSKWYQFGTIHTHPNDDVHIPMFSHDDIYTLYSIATNYGINAYNTSGNDLFVSVLAVKIGGIAKTYAIKIEDLTKLQSLQLIHSNQREWDKYGGNLRKQYEEKANGANGSETEYERTFLQFIKEQNLGVSLYQMEQLNAGTPQVQEKWTKLELNNDNTTINEAPCND